MCGGQRDSSSKALAVKVLISTCEVSMSEGLEHLSVSRAALWGWGRDGHPARGCCAVHTRHTSVATSMLRQLNQLS